jgi:hypothetical protein
MKEIRSKINIHAPIDRVWSVLADFRSYGEWNPFIYDVSGEPKEGEKIRIKLRTPSGRERAYEPVIIKVEPRRELRWSGKSTFLAGEHVFLLQQLGPESTELVQQEIFRGILSRFFGESTENDISGGFGQMNEALKARAES